MTQADLVERFADLFHRPIFRCSRISRRAAERARRHVGLLREHEEPAIRMEIDAAVAPGPQPGNRAYQRALPGPGFAGDQQPFTRLHNHFRIADYRGAIVQRYREIVQTEDRITFDFSSPNAADAVAALGALKPVE